MKITDGIKTADITMKVWDKANSEWKFGGENIAEDFFEAGTLARNDEGAYMVEDVDYCIDEAKSWEARTDYTDPDNDDPNEERVLIVE